MSRGSAQQKLLLVLPVCVGIYERALRLTWRLDDRVAHGKLLSFNCRLTCENAYKRTV